MHTGEVVRRRRHGARAAGAHRRLLHDVGVAGGLTGRSARGAGELTSRASELVSQRHAMSIHVATSQDRRRRRRCRSPAAISIGDLLAQTPPGQVLESKFKGLADIALTKRRRAGCSYADIRFTRATNNGVNASGGNRVPGDDGDGGVRRRRRTRRRAAAAAAAAVAAADAAAAAAAGGRRHRASARPASACA